VSTSGGTGGPSANLALFTADAVVLCNPSGTIAPTLGLNEQTAIFADQVNALGEIGFDYTSVALLVPAMSVVSEVPGITITSDTTHFGLDVQAYLEVSNMVGTQHILVTTNEFSAPAPGVNTFGANWAAATTSEQVGADLAWASGTGVSSTAGGIYVVHLWGRAQWAN
jgi:hypothetical protein